MVVVGAGTGGTVAGIGHKFKENMPNVQVWGEGRGEEEEGGRRRGRKGKKEEKRRRRGVKREEEGGGRYMYSGAENGREGEKEE